MVRTVDVLESERRASTRARLGTLARVAFLRRAFGDWPLFVLFVAPNLLLLAVFTYWPLVYSGYLSFMQWDLISPVKVFVGLENYRFLLTDREFHEVLRNTVVFTVGTVGGTMALGLVFALLLDQPLRGIAVARGFVFVPYVLSGAAVAVFWVNMLNPRFGVVGQVASWLGTVSPDWLNHPQLAMVAVILVSIWKNVGFATIVYLAGLQRIPQELYEAATVDGAGALARFRAVTLPQLGPITLFLVVVSTIASFQAFDLIKVLTDGGPVNATTTLLFSIWEQGFVAFDAGRAAAASVLLFALLAVISLLQVRLGERRVSYD
ncbi:sugar ABC transporter permease [Thermomicrobium sp. 4228-Ro]|uniref:carbohydrate ABC transporter permease n=1 Tax=Thermomicrobium sp. 4228-Ro TaxID=2993937 RepID=UPI002248F5D9|nr:sugar ABC transporter permease [Thermomicrobium sp. 4228-Ro]MCX2728266.1 sugar ABC transporter permease [Thermomicrobium sp. 4228-Ro]